MPDELEREIEDILRRLDRFVPNESRFTRLRRRWRIRFRRLQGEVAARLSRISLGHVMVVSLLLIGAAFFLRWTVVGRYALLAGLLLLFSTIVISFLTNRRAPRDKRWRGQPMDLSGPSFVDRLKAWFNRRRGPRY